MTKTATDLENAEFLFGNIEAARQACETEAIYLVDGGAFEDSPIVVALDKIVIAIEQFQENYGDDD